MSILLLLALLADAPSAAIAAPSSAAPGELMVLDASASVGDVFLWESLDDVPVLAVDGGRRLVVASCRAGTYRFVLVTAGIDKAKAALSTARCTVKIEAPAPSPPTEPAPPPPAPPIDPIPAPGKPGGPPAILGAQFQEVTVRGPTSTFKVKARVVDGHLVIDAADNPGVIK